jgi:catechol 2,3-dioxygenase-like lactoylglutathione lyase family enzyme
MKLAGIHHLNIRCTEADLGPIEEFYTRVVGLRKGYRPDFKNTGIWLYDGDHPLVHVTVRCKDGDLGGAAHNSAVDHIAFRSTGAADFQAYLDGLGVKYEQQNVPQAGYQIFLRDPMGTMLEFNFPNEEAPVAVASGTLAPRTKVKA